MRIAYFSDNFYPELSGIADSIMTTGRELARRGHHIAYVAPYYSDKNYEMLKRSRDYSMGPNVEFFRMPSFPFPTGTGQGRLALPIGATIPALRRFNPDVLHFNLVFGTGLEAIRASKRLKKPLVGTCHTPLVEFLEYSPIRGPLITEWTKRYDGWFHNHARFLSSPTRFIFEEMTYFDQKIPHAAVSNPIDVERFRPSPKPEDAEKYFTILYAGRIASEKRIDLVMQAVAKVKNSIPNIRFVIVGRGGYEKELRALAQTLGIENAVDFRGFLPEEKLPAVYHESDVFAIMSTAETQSLVAMQALACEVPVLVADAWGFKEYVIPEVGFRIPPGNVDALAEKILLLYKDSDLRKTLGKQGRKHVEQFSIENIAKRWEEIYGQAIAAK